MPLGRLPNALLRPREYLLHKEVYLLVRAAGRAGRNGDRDRALVLLMYFHGLRVSEAIRLRWAQVDFVEKALHVNRIKNGKESVHYILPVESEVLEFLREKKIGPFIFISERGTPFTRTAVNKIISRAGKLAGFEFPVHPHMLRHACGYYLANKGIDTRTIQDYLGHRSIQHTVRYTALAKDRFRGLWD